MPAALRPSDLFSRSTPIPNYPRALDTPPASKDNSFDSKADASKKYLDVSTVTTRPYDSDNNNVLDRSVTIALEKKLSRTSQIDLERGFGEVKGLASDRVPETGRLEPDGLPTP